MQSSVTKCLDFIYCQNGLIIYDRTVVFNKETTTIRWKVKKSPTHVAKQCQIHKNPKQNITKRLPIVCNVNPNMTANRTKTL